MKKCGQIMSKDVACCVKEATVEQVAELMKDCDIGCLPVVDDIHGKVVIGIVTDRDLTIRVLGERRDPRTTTMKEVMTRQPITCFADDDVDQAMELMKHRSVRRLPIVDRDNRLAGMITISDVAVKLDSAEKTASLTKAVSSPNIAL